MSGLLRRRQFVPMYIRAGDVKEDDVITLDGTDYKVDRVEKYRKLGRWWVRLCVVPPMADIPDLTDQHLPMDVIIAWRGTALS
jgi:hypothetical protein